MRVLGRADAGRMPGGSSSDAGRMLDGCWADVNRNAERMRYLTTDNPTIKINKKNPIVDGRFADYRCISI